MLTTKLGEKLQTCYKSRQYSRKDSWFIRTSQQFLLRARSDQLDLFPRLVTELFALSFLSNFWASSQLELNFPAVWRVLKMLQVSWKMCNKTHNRSRERLSYNSASNWYQDISYPINYCHVLPFTIKGSSKVSLTSERKVSFIFLVHNSHCHRLHPSV